MVITVIYILESVRLMQNPHIKGKTGAKGWSSLKCFLYGGAHRQKDKKKDIR